MSLDNKVNWSYMWYNSFKISYKQWKSPNHGSLSIATEVTLVNEIDFSLKISLRSLNIHSPLVSVSKVFDNSNSSCILSFIINWTYSNNNASLPCKVDSCG